MSQIQNQNPGSTEIQSPLIAGITEALNKISSVLSMNVGSLSDAQLTPVSIDESPDNQRRIYEAPQGSRLWLSEPVPVFKINGSVITQEQYSFSIDYVGGSITFTTSQKPSASDKVTVTASYIINQSKFVNDINSAVSDLEKKSARYKGSFENKGDLILAHSSGENGDFAILFSPFAVYAWKNDGWYDTRSIEDLSDYYKKSEVDNLLNQKEPTIPNKGSSASDDNYYWGGRKTWQDLFAKVRSVTLTGLNTATSTAVTATDTVLSSIGKLQGQVNKIISDGFGFKSFSKSVFPEDKTGNIDPTSPMLMANLTATSAADRLDHVVVPGKTTQEGSGDPSPANVRALSGVGRKMVKLPITSSENWVKTTSPSGNIYFECAVGSAPVPQSSIAAEAANAQFCNVAKIGNTDFYPSIMRIYARAQNGQNVIRIGEAGLSEVEGLKAYLDTANAVIYYTPADESQATGWYTWEAVDGDTYAAVGLPLNGQLYDGDSVANDVPSGCDVELILDGSEDERWINSTTTAKRYVSTILKGKAVPKIGYCDTFAFLTSGDGTEVGWCTIDVNGSLYFNTTFDTVEDWKSALQKNPVSFWYRSNEYSETSSVKVQKETHQMAVLVLDGTENIAFITSNAGKRIGINAGSIPRVPSSTSDVGNLHCTHYKPVSRGATDSGESGVSFFALNSKGFYIVDDRYMGDSDVTNFKAYLAEQYAAGTPVTILYELATPAVYAHPAQPLKNPEGEWELSGENTPVGYMRPLTDADRTDYAEQAKQADNADQLAGQVPAWYMPPGLMAPFAGSTAPAGWLLCDGRTLQSDRYPELYAAIGTTYGQNKPGSFKLPDMRGRVAAGANASNALASRAGADSKQITRANLPAEKLNLEDNGIWIVDSIQTGSESGRMLQMGMRSGAARLETNTLGSGTAFDVRQATLYLNYIIKY